MNLCPYIYRYMFKDWRYEESALKLDALRLVTAEARHSTRSQTRSTKLLPLLQTHLEDCIKLIDEDMPGGGFNDRDTEKTLTRSACMPFDNDFIKARPHLFKVSTNGYLKVRISDDRRDEDEPNENSKQWDCFILLNLD